MRIGRRECGTAQEDGGGAADEAAADDPLASGAATLRRGCAPEGSAESAVRLGAGASTREAGVSAGASPLLSQQLIPSGGRAPHHTHAVPDSQIFRFPFAVTLSPTKPAAGAGTGAATYTDGGIEGTIKRTVPRGAGVGAGAGAGAGAGSGAVGGEDDANECGAGWEMPQYCAGAGAVWTALATKLWLYAANAVMYKCAYAELDDARACSAASSSYAIDAGVAYEAAPDE